MGRETHMCIYIQLPKFLISSIFFLFPKYWDARNKMIMKMLQTCLMLSLSFWNFKKIFSCKSCETVVIKRIGEVVAIQWLILPWVSDCLTGTWVLNCYLSFSIKVEEEKPCRAFATYNCCTLLPYKFNIHTHPQSMVTTKRWNNKNK